MYNCTKITDMNMKLLFTTMAAMLPAMASATTPFVGLYQTIDDKTNTPKSIVALYECTDGDDTELVGRIVALYGADGNISETLSNPTRTADAVKGAPKMVGLDIIWDRKYEIGDMRQEI